MRTTPEALKRRSCGLEPMRIAIETGTHSPWVSRLLEECSHEVVVANSRKVRLTTPTSVRATRSTPRTSPASHASIQLLYTEAKSAKLDMALIRWREAWLRAARVW